MVDIKMAFNFIQTERLDSVAIVTICRPESLNAINSQVLAELDQTLHELDGDPGVKAVILTGAGGKAFVAGGDIKEMLDLDVAAAHRFSRNGQTLVLFIQDMSKPVIAAVNGYALGGGLELALACDFIYASEKARFGLPEVTLGVLPGFGGTQTLARAIGPSRAKELVFSGRILTAQEALAWGLVNAVFPEAELLDRTLETARKISQNGTLAISSAKEALVQGLDLSRPEGFPLENDLFADLFSTEDQKEGMQAFIEKRKPEFKGR
jgi:enoyl-CoA hydratase